MLTAVFGTKADLYLIEESSSSRNERMLTKHVMNVRSVYLHPFIWMRGLHTIMAVDENLSLQLDLASTQIVTSVLVTLGATLFAISVGIQLALPPIVSDLVSQALIDPTVVPDIQYDVVQKALDNYVALLTTTGALLVFFGIVYGSVKIGGIRRKAARVANKAKGTQPQA
jgi:ABC-type amino acid transport system permease subunit